LKRQWRVSRDIKISSGECICFCHCRGRSAHTDRFMADKIMPLSEAVEGYDLFDKMKVQKVVFEAQK
jgi:hypothetical protein